MFLKRTCIAILSWTAILQGCLSTRLVGENKTFSAVLTFWIRNPPKYRSCKDGDSYHRLRGLAAHLLFLVELGPYFGFSLQAGPVALCFCVYCLETKGWLAAQLCWFLFAQLLCSSATNQSVILSTKIKIQQASFKLSWLLV